MAKQEIQAQQSLTVRFAQRYGVDADKMIATLKATAFRDAKEISNEQLMMLMLVAEKYDLDPFTRQIYAFPDRGGIVPVVGVDGWIAKINEHPELAGMEFIDGPEDADGLPEWIECRIYRKDRTHPIPIREYMAECKRNTPAWNSHPRRMLRHKALIQCARIAFGFTGIYDEDEAQRIIAAQQVQPQRLRDQIKRKAIAPAVEQQEPVEIIDQAPMIEDEFVTALRAADERAD